MRAIPRTILRSIIVLITVGTLFTSLAAKSAEDDDALMDHANSPWVGDLDGMFERGFIRLLTIYNPLSFSYNGIDQRGLAIDVARALDLDPKKIPRHSIIKEKRATFSQTPTSLYTRPKTKGQSGRLYLAGDWTNTGIPATIESAVRSGFMAAKAVLKAL